MLPRGKGSWSRMKGLHGDRLAGIQLVRWHKEGSRTRHSFPKLKTDGFSTVRGLSNGCHCNSAPAFFISLISWQTFPNACIRSISLPPSLLFPCPFALSKASHFRNTSPRHALDLRSLGVMWQTWNIYYSFFSRLLLSSSKHADAQPCIKPLSCFS